jgi:putative membrane protein
MSGYGGFGMFSGMLLFWVAIIVLVVFAARGLFRSDKRNEGEHTPATAKEILELRYARGEITAEQFKQMQKDLQ